MEYRSQNNLSAEPTHNLQIMPENYGNVNLGPHYPGNSPYNAFTPAAYNMPGMGYNMNPGFSQTIPVNQGMMNTMDVSNPYGTMTPQKPPRPPPMAPMAPQNFASPPSNIPGTGETNYSILNNSNLGNNNTDENTGLEINTSFESAETMNLAKEGQRGHIGK